MRLITMNVVVAEYVDRKEFLTPLVGNTICTIKIDSNDDTNDLNDRRSSLQGIYTLN